MRKITLNIKPCGHRVLVLPDEVSDRRGSLYVPQTVRSQEQYAQIYGVLVAVGENAWKAFDDGRPWAQVGQRVCIAKYGGFEVIDPITEDCYRLLNDEDICAVIGDEILVEVEMADNFELSVQRRVSSFTMETK